MSLRQLVDGGSFSEGFVDPKVSSKDEQSLPSCKMEDFIHFYEESFESSTTEWKRHHVTVRY
jgi:hypothetical protein